MRPLSPIFSPDVLLQFSTVADSVVDYTLYVQVALEDIRISVHGDYVWGIDTYIHMDFATLAVIDRVTY